MKMNDIKQCDRCIKYDTCRYIDMFKEAVRAVDDACRRYGESSDDFYEVSCKSFMRGPRRGIL